MAETETFDVRNFFDERGKAGVVKLFDQISMPENAGLLSLSGTGSIERRGPMLWASRFKLGGNGLTPLGQLRAAAQDFDALPPAAQDEFDSYCGEMADALEVARIGPLTDPFPDEEKFQ